MFGKIVPLDQEHVSQLLLVHGLEGVRAIGDDC